MGSIKIRITSLKCRVGLSRSCEVRLSREEFGVEVEKMKARVTELMTEKFGEKCRILTVKGKVFLLDVHSSSQTIYRCLTLS